MCTCYPCSCGRVQTLADASVFSKMSINLPADQLSRRSHHHMSKSQPARLTECQRETMCRAHVPVPSLARWWLHFGCIAAVTSCQRVPHTVTGSRREEHLSVLQSWKSCLEKAHQMLAASPGYVTQLLCALLQAQLVATDLGTCLSTLRQLQHSISRCSLNSQSPPALH